MRTTETLETTILLTAILALTFLVFGSVIKPKFESFLNDAVKPIKVEKVRL